MALSAKIQLKQTQSLVITPQLMQAIRLLQMSGLELGRFVTEELEQNPLLERKEENDGATFSDCDSVQHASGGFGDDSAGETDAEPDRLFPADFPVGSGWFLSPSRHTGSSAGTWKRFGPDQNIPAAESLEALLEGRIDAVFVHAPEDRAIALALLAGLDAAGYLTIAPETVAERLGAAREAVEHVLSACQDLAPTGIFARSLAECLALQLAERNRLDAPMRMLLDNLGCLATGERAALCVRCGVDREALERMIAEIRALDPKPGLAFDREPVSPLIPDVVVRAAPGGWIVELNDAILPRLIVNHSYFAAVSQRLPGDSDRKYLADCLQKASWLERSLDQRARTVLKVASEIVRRQKGFLANGVAYLKPLNLRMVADALGIHESTVSRGAANKLIATPRGIFEFRYFFTGSIPAAAGGEAHSAAAVKHRIRKMISEESPDAVLSDDSIVAILSREGIEIARRTVAKYRELMHIGSSVDRRREKRLRAAS
jgi:RNA polymerase sigma-54 factor